MDIKYLDGKIEEKSNAIQTLATEKESIINYIQEFGVRYSEQSRLHFKQPSESF